MCMENGEDESEVTQKRAQDLIETIAPPRAKRSVTAEDEPASSDELEIDWGEPEHELIDAGCPVSPDDIPTERPPWSDPAESRERLIQGVPVPAQKKNA